MPAVPPISPPVQVHSRPREKRQPRIWGRLHLLCRTVHPRTHPPHRVQKQYGTMKVALSSRASSRNGRRGYDSMTARRKSMLMTPSLISLGTSLDGMTHIYVIICKPHILYRNPPVRVTPSPRSSHPASVWPPRTRPPSPAPTPSDKSSLSLHPR